MLESVLAVVLCLIALASAYLGYWLINRLPRPPDQLERRLIRLCWKLDAVCTHLGVAGAEKIPERVQHAMDEGTVFWWRGDLIRALMEETGLDAREATKQVFHWIRRGPEEKMDRILEHFGLGQKL